MTLTRPVFLVLVVALLALHFPFLEADPDIDISFSRGPFTDEGLNTIQLRNLVDHGYLDLTECDNLLKTPLFNIYLAPFFYIAGTRLAVARLAILFAVLALFFFISKDRMWRNLLVFLILTALLQYHLFHFSHFSLAEMMAVALILGGIHSSYRYLLSKDRRYLLLSGLLISFSYYAKIQFIYIIPLTMALYFLSGGMKDKRGLLYAVISIAGPAILYLFAWYLPFRQEYIMMMKGQSGTFSIDQKVFDYLRFNIESFFLVGEMWLFTGVFLFSLVAGIYFLLLRSRSRLFQLVFPASLAWFILESHKLLMVYLPTRYRVGLLFAMALLISSVLYEWTRNKEDLVARKSNIFAWLIAGLLLVSHVYDLKNSYSRRTFHLKKVNAYMDKATPLPGPVIGAWAPSFTWESDQRAFPVWNDFLNYKDPIKNYRPSAVISEFDEEDSNQAYKKQGIDLHALADSVHKTQIGHWSVEVVWIGGDKH